MYQNWVDATAIGEKVQRDIWAVDWAAHPLLDPDFQRNPRIHRCWKITHKTG